MGYSLTQVDGRELACGADPRLRVGGALYLVVVAAT